MIEGMLLFVYGDGMCMISWGDFDLNGVSLLRLMMGFMSFLFVDIFLNVTFEGERVLRIYIGNPENLAYLFILLDRLRPPLYIRKVGSEWIPPH